MIMCEFVTFNFKICICLIFFYFLKFSVKLCYPIVLVIGHRIIAYFMPAMRGGGKEG